MISIRKASEDLDRLEQMIQAAKESYVHAIWSAAQYTIELDPGESKRFREHLDGIRAEAEKATYPSDWPSIQASFRGELRDYRDRSVAQLTKLKAEMKAAADAMQIFADSVATTSADHEEDLHHALNHLDRAAQEESLKKVRVALVQTKTEINSSVERMQRSHQLVIAQLRDEIRLLHQQMDAERHAIFMDSTTGVWNHQKLESQLQGLLDGNTSFCLLVVCIRNLKRLDQRYSPTVLESGVKALLQRLTALLGPGAMLGRWDEELFAAILHIEPAIAISLSREATKRLSGTYSVQENGMSRSIALQAAAGVLERTHEMDSAAFHKRLVQMTEALSHI